MALTNWWVVALVLAPFLIQAVYSVGQCGKGQMLYTPSSGPDVCHACMSEHFMPEVRHTHRQCYACTDIQDPQLEILVSPCNKTHDTEIHCIDGYYRTQPPYPDDRGQCQKCTECLFPKRRCQKFSDTVCCPQYYYGVYIDRDGKPKCVQQCARGQMLDPVKDECVTCPHGTYMDEGRHINIRCKECEIVRSLQEKIFHPCTSIHQTDIGCIEGFYRQRQSDSFSLCVPCQNCYQNTDGNIYEGRACDQSRDTVCCSQPDMSVVDTGDWARCISKSANSTAETRTTSNLPVCREGEYLFTNARAHTATCQACPQGTYMDETEHTRGACKSCEECVKFCPAETVECKAGDDVGLTVGVIVGLVVGIVVVLVVMAVLFFRVRRKRHGRRPSPSIETTSLMTPSSTQEGVSTGSGDSTSLQDTPYNKGFILVEDFKTQDLPIAYSDAEMVDLIKHQAHLTVLVDVDVSSQHRPALIPGTDKPYPYSGGTYKNPHHKGSGWVERVKMYKDQRCPCMTCQQSAQPVTSWGEVVICTAARVVFDITEGRNSRCYFFYDTPDTDLQSCHSLSGAVKVLSDTQRDWCYMTFVTHNVDLVKQLQEIYIKYQSLRREVKFKHGIGNDHMKWKGVSQSLEELSDTYNHRLGQLEYYRKYSREIKDDDHMLFPLKGALGINDGDIDKREQFRQILSKLHKSYELSQETVKELSNTCQNIQPDSKDEANLHEQYWYLFHKANELDRYLRRLNFNLGSSSDTPYKPRYGRNYAFTVIVSHPGGYIKKISLGEDIDRIRIEFDSGSSYLYTNITGTGSEGARVFVLGRGGPSDHGHSGTVGQQGVSGTWYEIIPYIADFSVEAAE